MAAQLGDDLAQFLPAGELAVFPAWETLPFERVSPSVETMGQRLELLWRLRDPERCPAVIVTGVRALLQRLGPDAVDDRADRRPPRPTSSTPTSSSTGWRSSATGARSSSSTAASSPGAARSSTSSRRPATRPIRIDLWGDEVDRLTRFSVNDQRSIDDLAERAHLPGPRADPERRGAGPGVEARRRRAVGPRAVGAPQRGRRCSTAWRAGCRGSPSREQLLTDVLPANAKVVLVEPRRMRDRAVDLLAEEDDLAKALASTWERDPDKPFPRLHAEPDRILAGRRRARGRSTRRRSRPTRRSCRRRAGVRSPATASALVTRLTQLLADGYRVVVAADGEGSAERLAGAAARPRPRPARPPRRRRAT